MLCAYHLATVHLTRLSRAWRAPHCFHALCVLHCQGSGSAYDFLRSLRTSAHTGVAIRIPHGMHISVAERLGERIATPDDVGHWLAMTVEDWALPQPPYFRLQIGLVILSVPTIFPQSEQYNRVRRKQCFRQ